MILYNSGVFFLKAESKIFLVMDCFSVEIGPKNYADFYYHIVKYLTLHSSFL